MICISDKKECCGCAACVQRCPKHCISMVEDTEGFLYPSVNKEFCVDCKVCESVCPILNKYENFKKQIAYAAYAQDDSLRMKSSSGAIFSLLAKCVLDDDGVVFGAAFDEDLLVHHIGISTKDELSKLQGSKYLQSRIENTFYEAESFLKQGRKVLYSGTACQIAGLKKFLNKEYENLFTVDVLCHGVPSPKVWKNYLNETEQKLGKCQSAYFRDKSTGWKTYSLKFVFKDETECSELSSENPYMRLFLSNICLRPSCHACRYKSIERPSDITLGDSWGIQNYKPHMDDDKGVSVVIVHSDKGIKLFDSCSENMIFEKAEVDKILPPTSDSRKSVIMHPKRGEFFKSINNGVQVEQLIKLVEPSLSKKIKRKIGNMFSKIKNI